MLNGRPCSWTVPSTLEEALTYRVAVWDTASRICGISTEFGISSELVRLSFSAVHMSSIPFAVTPFDQAPSLYIFLRPDA